MSSICAHHPSGILLEDSLTMVEAIRPFGGVRAKCSILRLI